MSIEIVTHNGRRVSAIRHGAGPLIVLLPPGASPAAAWRGVMDDLSSGFECLAVNPSGYAETDDFQADWPMSLDDEVEAVLALIASRKETIHLVGHSYGGAIAVKLAQRHEFRFSTLTLIEPAVYPLLSQAGENDLANEVRSVNELFIGRVRAGANERAFQEYFDYYNAGSLKWTDLSHSVKQRFLSISEQVAVALAAVHACEASLQDLEKLRIPALLVTGAETDAAHARLTEIVAQHIPNSRSETIATAGHMCSLTHPNEVAALIRSNIFER
ncbi:MAG: alpha/beta fold hydrolase [Hyphomicrobiaceae bacterium]